LPLVKLLQQSFEILQNDVGVVIRFEQVVEVTLVLQPCSVQGKEFQFIIYKLLQCKGCPAEKVTIKEILSLFQLWLRL
jgi:hypothetical protein